MDYAKSIQIAIESGRSGDIEALQDAFTMTKALEVDGAVYIDGVDCFHDADNFRTAHSLIKELRRVCSEMNKHGRGSVDVSDLYWKCHLFDAPYEFDSFCIYLERDREDKKKFYVPRRKQLLPLVEAMQDLADRKIELLCLSCPPGIGKTTLAEFFLAFESGRHPELPNLTGSHNNAFLNGVYGEMLRILDPYGEYKWHDIFPRLKVVNTNAKDMLIDISNEKKRGKRFATLEFTSVGSGNAGKVRAMNLLYCDDLVDGIETAMSKDRLDKLYHTYTTDLRQRKQGDFCAELHIATRWSVNDPIGRLERQYEGDEKARFISFPALNEDDESNWHYPYGLGYSTEMLHQQREIMDDVSWRCIYMNDPIEREGTLYAADELRYFFELPEKEPDAIFSVCDTKEQGMDYCVMPFAYQYGQDYYIDAFICDNGKPDIIEKRIVNDLCERNVQMSRFESNRGGTIFAENVQKGVKDKGGRTRISTKWNQTNKDTRIIVSSGWVKEHCLFRHESVRDKEYKMAMQFLTGYTMAGKNAHDDVPDAMADIADFAQSYQMNKVEVFKRPF